MFIGFGSIEDVYKFKEIGKFFIDSYNYGELFSL